MTFGSVALYISRNNCITADNLTSLEEYQKSLDEQKKKAIAEFEKKLGERLSRASKAYTDMIGCHEQRLNERIAKYVAQYATCLSTRKTKIESYVKCLSERFERRLKCITERLEKVDSVTFCFKICIYIYIILAKMFRLPNSERNSI